MTDEFFHREYDVHFTDRELNIDEWKRDKEILAEMWNNYEESYRRRAIVIMIVRAHNVR